MEKAETTALEQTKCAHAARKSPPDGGLFVFRVLQRQTRQPTGPGTRLGRFLDLGNLPAAIEDRRRLFLRPVQTHHQDKATLGCR
jgi:hypothetical protein